MKIKNICLLIVWIPFCFIGNVSYILCNIFYEIYDIIRRFKTVLEDIGDK